MVTVFVPDLMPDTAHRQTGAVGGFL